jgi:DNA-binding IclR family transcriptional regulator
VVPGNRRAMDDPQRLSASVLDLVLLLSRGHCGAVFSLTERAPLLVASHALHHEALAAGLATWHTRQADLARGAVLYQPAALAIPVMADQQLLGYVHVDAPDPTFRFLDSQLATFTEILLRALRAVSLGTGGPPGPILGLGWTVDAERARLLRLLEEQEWNLSRVARELGVQRQTIYNWLERLGIERKKVPKTT